MITAISLYLFLSLSLSLSLYSCEIYNVSNYKYKETKNEVSSDD